MLNSSYNSLTLRCIGYLLLLVLLSGTVFFGLAFFFSFHQSIDWVLVGVYGVLAGVAYFFFIVNDLFAKKQKNRVMPIGFLFGSIAFLLVACSFVFVIPAGWDWFVAGILLIVGYGCCAFGLTQWAKHQAQKEKTLMIESMTDQLTGLFNRRAFAINVIKELEFSQQAKSDFSVMILDIDDFKPINDKYGHSIGDKVLCQISGLLQRYTRDADSVYRWGGEEFVVLLPVTGLFEANQLAQKLLTKVSEQDFQVEFNHSIKLSVSIGLAQWMNNESLVNDTLVRADKALYKAKSRGKNNVVVADYIDSSHKPSETNKKQISTQLFNK